VANLVGHGWWHFSCRFHSFGYQSPERHESIRENDTQYLKTKEEYKMLAKKVLSFVLVFIAGMVFGTYMIFWNAWELGLKSAKINEAIYAKPSAETIHTIFDTMNSLPVIANTIAQLNWGYLQWALLLLFILGIALGVWPSKKEGEEKNPQLSVG